MVIMLYTNFQSKKFPKEKTWCKCLPLIMTDSVVKAKKNYYPQKLLDNWKYENNKMENFTTGDLEASSSDNETDVTLMTMKVNLTTRKIMMNLINNFLNAKKVF